jgi:hypothetical protein
MVRDFAPKQMVRLSALWAVLRIRLAGFAGDEAQRMAKIAEAHEVLGKLKLSPESPPGLSVREVEITSATAAKAANPQEALDRFERAEDALRGLGSEAKPVLSKMMLSAAEAALDLGNIDLAAKKVKEAREYYLTIADPEGQQLAVCDAVLAFRDWQDGKDRQRARANLERAVAHLQAALGPEHPRVLQWQARLHQLDARMASADL